MNKPKTLVDVWADLLNPYGIPTSPIQEVLHEAAKKPAQPRGKERIRLGWPNRAQKARLAASGSGLTSLDLRGLPTILEL